MSDILAHENVFIPHRFPSHYNDLHELEPHLHNAKNILLESFYDRNLMIFSLGRTYIWIIADLRMPLTRR